MSEQNITNVIEYLDQNPDQPVETLVINLLNEGYPVEDIKAALDRQGISPLAIPGYQETIVYSSTKPASGKWLLIVGLILSLIIIGIIIYIAYSYVNRNTTSSTTNQSGGIAERTAKNLNSTTPTPLPTTAPGKSIAPMLRSAFEQEDFKITSNQITVYVDNGALARIEKNDGKIYLDWSAAVTILDVATKTYNIYYPSKAEAQAYYNTRYNGIIPFEIMADTEAGKLDWKQIDSTTWESIVGTKQRIIIDPQTKFITKRQLLNMDGSILKEDTIQYEKITVTKSLIEIPSDYKPAP